MSKNFNSTTNLPDGWRWVKLGELCEEKTATRDPRLQPMDTFCYVDISSVDNTQKRILDASVLFGKDAPSRARQVINAGDVIVSTTRPNLNAVALVPHELDNQICSTGFCVLRPKIELDRDYLFAYVCSSDFVKNLSDLVKGALYPAVTDKQVKAQVIPLPPLPEQKRIAAILNEQMAAVEKARAAAEAQRKAAKALSGAYLRKVFKYKTGDKLPDGWRWVRFEEIIEGTRNGLYKPDDFYGKGIPILKMFNIGRFDGQWFLNRVDRIHLTAEESDYFKLRCGDILINRVNSRELVGKCAVVNESVAGAVYESKNIRLRVFSKSADSHYVAIWLNSFECRKQIESQLKQIVGQATINRSDLNAIHILFPPLPEQKRIATIFNEQMVEADRLRKSVDEQLNTIKSLPAAFLRQAFSGEL